MEQPPVPPDESPGSTPGSGLTPSRSPSWLSIVVVVLILAGFGLTAYYGVRALRAFREMHRVPLRPGITDVSLVRGWMTVPYIAHAFRVPEAEIWQGLGIPERGNRAKSLRTLDRQYAGGQPGAVLEKVKAILTQYQGQQPGNPTPTSPPNPAQLRRYRPPEASPAG
jgi:hypothetical protein